MSKIEKLIDKSKDLLKTDNYPEVIKICAEILEIESDNEFALRFMGISNYHLKNYEESEKYLEKAYINNPTDKKIIMDYGITLFEVGKLDKALTLYDFYFNSEDKSRRSEVEEYFVTISKKCSHRNKTKDAIKCYNYYLDKESDSVVILKSKIQLYSHLKKFDDALSCYDLLIDINDDGKINSCLDKILCVEAKAFYQYDKGFLNKSKDTFALASEYYIKKYNIDLTILNPWHKHLSNSLTESPDSSQKFFKNLFIVDEEDSMGWCNLIDYLTRRYDSYGDIDIMICDWLLEKNPDSIPILDKKAELHTNWKPTTSLKLYEKILEIDESNTKAIKGKLDMLIKLKWYGKINKYIKSLPTNINWISDKLNLIAKVLTNKKKYSEALNCYEKILEINPSEVSAITNIRKVWDKAGMKDAKKKSKYYMDWIDVILSHNNTRWCSEEGCDERLSHIVHGVDGNRLMERPQTGIDLIITDYIDCDDDATHYCPKCKKIYKYGIEGFDYNTEDVVLYEYTVTLILALEHYIQNGYYGENLTYVQERFHDEYFIDKREFNAFINKLEELGYIQKNVMLNFC